MLRLESLLQKESRDASAFAIGVVGELSIDGVEAPEVSEGEGDAERSKSISSDSVSVLKERCASGVITFTWSLGENWTRAGEGRESVAYCAAESLLSVSGPGSGASAGDAILSIVLLEMSEGRECAKFREAKVFNVILARDSTRGIAVTLFTP